MVTSLLAEIQSHGHRGAVIPFSRIDDIKQDFFDLQNGDYHPSWLDRMAKHITSESNKFLPSGMDFTPRSVITIVMPSSKVLLRFNYRGKLINCVVPQGYTNGEQNNKLALQYLQDFLKPHGYSVAMAVTVAQKLLAVHSGLTMYGRNNVSYNEEFGSYIQLITFFTDMPCGETDWFPLRRMEICENCGACVNACPTNAIDSDRRLINSDRCLTFYNEISGDFPEWIEKNAHNSIVGCIECQDCCPANAKNKDNVKIGVEFTEAETLEVLNNQNDAPFSDSVSAKIEATGVLSEYREYFPRNLSVLLAKEFSD